uniref:Uncharacterized protein n=1 Tax=Solanum tuberosum TaxID=4113 RepID=M1DVQ8_SOLTU
MNVRTSEVPLIITEGVGGKPVNADQEVDGDFKIAALVFEDLLKAWTLRCKRNEKAEKNEEAEAGASPSTLVDSPK